MCRFLVKYRKRGEWFENFRLCKAELSYSGFCAVCRFCREVMMKNGLPRRPSYGSLSQAAVKPQAHITRQAPPFTACTSVQIMPTAEQGQCMTRLLQCCVSITPFRALCRAVRMTSQRSLPTRTESTASHWRTATASFPITAFQALTAMWVYRSLEISWQSAPP